MLRSRRPLPLPRRPPTRRAAEAATEPAKAAAPAAEPAAQAEVAAEAAPTEAGDEFMRDLVAAMRAVADEARQAGVTDLKTSADEQIQTLDAEAERRREELRKAADTDVAGVGEWAAAEADRIKREAEQKRRSPAGRAWTRSWPPTPAAPRPSRRRSATASPTTSASSRPTTLS